MDYTKIILIIGAVLIVSILLWTGANFLSTFAESTTKICTETEFRSSQGFIKGEVFKGYDCPAGYRQEFADFEDVPKFNLCCAKD